MEKRLWKMQGAKRSKSSKTQKKAAVCEKKLLSQREKALQAASMRRRWHVAGSNAGKWQKKLRSARNQQLN